MASPFSVFRKNQWILLAVFGVLLMVSFVILPPIMQFMGGQAGVAENPVVVKVTRTNQEITEFELSNLIRRRALANNFVAQSYSVIFPGQNFGQMQAFGPATREHVVNTMLLVQRAEELGVVISDQAVIELIKETTDDKLTSDQIRKICSNLNMDTRQLFDILRFEMKAIYARDLVLGDVPGVTPQQRWEEFKKTHDRVKLEILPLDIASLANSIPDPGDEKLKEFFDKHKDKIAPAESLEPGFRLPPRTAFEYVMVDNSIADRVEATIDIKDEEITAYYEANKDALYKDIIAGFEPDTTTTPPATPEKTEPEKTTPEKTEPEKTTPEKTTPDKTEDNKTPAPSTETPAKTEPEKKTPEKKEPEKKEPTNAEGAAPDQCAPEDEKAAKEKDAKDKSAPPAATEGPALGQPTEKKEGDKPATENKTPDKSADPPTTTPAETTPPTTTPATEVKPEEKPVKYKPLNDELKAEIRKTLVRQAGQKELETRMAAVRKAVQTYGSKYARWLTAEQLNPASAPAKPKQPNFAELAEKEGLHYSRTEPWSVFDAQSNESLGSSIVVNQFRGFPSSQEEFFFNQFARRAFQEEIRLFDPQFARNFGGQDYLFWKADNFISRVPDFKEVRATVLRAWQYREAREQAKKLTEQFVAESANRTAPLREIFEVRKNDLPTDLSLPKSIDALKPSDALLDAIDEDTAAKITTTRDFSWMNQPLPTPNTSRTPAPALSQVPGLNGIDDAFLKQVFSLQEGQYAALPNESQTTFYIVRVVKTTPASKFEFVQSDPRSYDYLASRQQTDFVQARIKELILEYGLVWNDDVISEE